MNEQAPKEALLFPRRNSESVQVTPLDSFQNKSSESTEIHLIMIY